MSSGGGADLSVKQVSITGGAAESYATGTRKRRRTGGKRQVPAEAMAVVVAPTPVPTAAAAPAKAATAAPTQTAVANQETAGGSQTRKQVKVILAPPSGANKKKAAAKVVLTPAKAKTTQTTVKKLPDKTRKVSKKIRMSLGGLSKRMTRAHSIRQEAKQVSLPEVKATLQKAGLIKQDSKAPEQVLRQMYADFQMLKNRAL